MKWYNEMYTVCTLTSNQILVSVCHWSQVSVIKVWVISQENKVIYLDNKQCIFTNYNFTI